MNRTPTRLSRVIALLATAVVLGSLTPATAAATPRPTATPSPTQPAPTVTSDKSIIDHGQTHQLTVTGPNGALAELYGNGRLLRQEILRPPGGGVTGSITWTQQPNQTTHYRVDIANGETGLVASASTVVRVRRTASMTVASAGRGFTLSGVIAPQQAGVRMTIARLDSVTGRVTGVASTVTGAKGYFQVSTNLPLGIAGYYAIVPRSSGLETARSGLYGVDVRQSISLYVSRSAGNTYVFHGGVRNGTNVPVTLARVVNGRLVGVAGGRTNADGRYVFRLPAAPGTHFFQVLTASAQSRLYGLVVPNPPIR